MAGALSQVFGASVLFIPQVGSPRSIQSIFRETPITVVDDNGHDVLIVAATWRVPKTAISDAAKGDQIELADGRRFRVLNRLPTGSPAADSFVLYKMELVA